MQKKIAKVSPSAFGHLMLEFEDATKQIVHRLLSKRAGLLNLGCD